MVDWWWLPISALLGVLGGGALGATLTARLARRILDDRFRLLGMDLLGGGGVYPSQPAGPGSDGAVPTGERAGGG